MKSGMASKKNTPAPNCALGMDQRTIKGTAGGDFQFAADGDEPVIDLFEDLTETSPAKNAMASLADIVDDKADNEDGNTADDDNIADLAALAESSQSA